jgi:hypothetical protein
MQPVDWVDEDDGARTALVYDPGTTARHRRRANRAAWIGILSMLVLSVAYVFTDADVLLSIALLPFGLSLAIGYALGSAQVWFRRLTLVGTVLELSWQRRRGHPVNVDPPVADAIRDRAESMLLFAAPPPVRIPLVELEEAVLDDQTLRLILADGVVEEVCLAHVQPAERAALVEDLQALATRAQGAVGRAEAEEAMRTLGRAIADRMPQ